MSNNLSYEALFQEEIKPELTEEEKGAVTSFGAVNVDTGKFTGRSPEDKFIVSPNDNIWWRDEKNPTSPNKPLAIEAWDYLFGLAQKELGENKSWVMDGYLGARASKQLKVRLVTEVAWQAHFFKNMFIPPSPARRQASEGQVQPDWTIYSAPKAIIPEWEKYGLNSEVAVAINFNKRQTIILGTWYGGEIKKGMFTVANYYLPLQGVGSFHCSANVGKKGDTCLFFGLSGTGKTTLSHDPNRLLIGDDEHAWDDEGVFNLEGGCYAKMINISAAGEPDIFKAIKKNALLENVVMNSRGEVDFTDASKTENTRMSYPIEHVERREKTLTGGHPKTVIFLTCDSFGVLPPVAKLNLQEAMYWYLSGYTAKVAGTERGILAPKETFSACFGQPFLPLHPTVYAKILGEKLKQYHTQVYLVNTGWSGGGYGVGQRMSLGITRQIVTEILEGRLAKAEYYQLAPFGLSVPKQFNPRNTWADKRAYDQKAKELLAGFKKNYLRFKND